MKSTVQWKKNIQRLHCTIVKMEISVLYHAIVNAELNRENLTRCYIIIFITITMLAEQNCSILVLQQAHNF